MRLECPPYREPKRPSAAALEAVPDHPCDDVDDVAATSQGARGWFRNGLSLLISVLVHCLLVVVLGLLSLSAIPGEPWPGEEVEVGLLPGETLTNQDATDGGDLNDASANSQEDFATEIALPEDPLAEEEQWRIEPPSLMSLGGGDLSSTAISSSFAGQGGSGAAGQASFMGVQALGRRFCVIADRSGSMGGRPIAHLKQEVRKTLDTMTQGSSIHLVFYSNHWTAFPHSWEQPRDIRDEAETFLRGIHAKGGTQPATAFQHAFDLKPPPDAIFFMTDGKIPGNMDKFVDRLNSGRNKKIPIHTIAFLNRAAVPLMERIAEQSGGKFRYVSGF